MPKFQHLLKSCDPGRLKPVIIDICLWSLGVWGVSPGSTGSPRPVDNSVDKMDKWSLRSLRSLLFNLSEQQGRLYHRINPLFT